MNLLGRMLGLALLHGHLFPVNFCRHVLKFLLGRTIRWHDLAFFDAELFENLRKLLLLTAGDIENMALTFEVFCFVTFILFLISYFRNQIHLRAELGGGAAALVPDGSNVAVTAENLSEVRLHIF